MARDTVVRSADEQALLVPLGVLSFPRLRVALTAGALLLAVAAPAFSQATWTPTSLMSAPGRRQGHTAVWTGSRMIVWGGVVQVYPAHSVRQAPDHVGSIIVVYWLKDGGIYDPSTDTWTATSTTRAPAARFGHTAVWTGSRMIVWGGDGGAVAVSSGGAYDPASDSWTATSTTGAPTARSGHTAVWTGLKMIVWGGKTSGSGGGLNDGGIYDPATDTWTAMSTTGAPVARTGHSAVWTGSRMIVWGGDGGGERLNTGGVYDPATDTWTATSTTGAPTTRSGHSGVWTGTRMIVWGGDAGGLVGLDDGRIYEPSTDTWTATSTTGAPAARSDHSAVWTGSKMIVWGGFDGDHLFNTGGVYDLATDAWTATAMINAPETRNGHTAVWAGTKMIVWGGAVKTGGVYEDPALLPRYSFYSLPPCRVADTRGPAGPSGGPALAANGGRTFPVSGICGVPPTAKAVAMNVTVAEPTDVGDLRIYASGSTMPVTSVVNFSAGKVRANNAVMPLGADGQISVHCDMPPGSGGQTQFLFDVTGYFQ